jgi:hypothetical protein
LRERLLRVALGETTREMNTQEGIVQSQRFPCLAC